MDDEFSFENYDVNSLKEKKNVELLQKNLQIENPTLIKEDVKKEQEFMDLGDTSEFFNEQPFDPNNPNINLSNTLPQQSSGMSLPYDTQNMGNSYLSLVLSPNLRELELMIRGLEYVKKRNEKTGKDEYVLRKIPDHPLNEYGINQIITQLKIYTSPEIKLGRKKLRDYYNSVNHVSKTITRLIYKNLKNFGMNTQEKQRNAKVFCDAIIEVIDSSYSRSIGGKENDLSRATDFRISGSIDSMSDINRMFSSEDKDKLKN